MRNLGFVVFALLALTTLGCTKIAKTMEIASFCEGNSNVTERDICFFDVAKETNDTTVCADIEGENLRNQCKAEVVPSPGGTSDSGEPNGPGGEKTSH
ncbi:MAG: hypothetical protein ABIF01_03385 [Candidatus Micrarchaeota archaeon]